MKKAFLLLLCSALAFAACDIYPLDPAKPAEQTPKDADLPGTQVSLDGLGLSARKIFVLNEGGMGSNNATLDFLRTSDALYVTGAFRKMNPDVGAGLGDVGNDIAVRGNEVWIVVNNSGIVEVLSAKDETEIAVITIPTPRNIAFDDKYVYVSSWAGAYATYGADYAISDYANPRGRVYRIDRKTKALDSRTVEVGYQPEGLALRGGKLYVANSGGIASSLPPSYSYDNTVSVINTASFSLEKTLEVQVNLKNVWFDGGADLYVSTLGNYYSVHSGIYRIDAQDAVTHLGDYASIAAMHDGTLYCIGNAQEFDWAAAERTWKGWKCKGGTVSDWSVTVNAVTPYGLCVLSGDAYLIGDAGDYFNPGTVSCWNGAAKRWSVTAGVCPAHFALW